MLSFGARQVGTEGWDVALMKGRTAGEDTSLGRRTGICCRSAGGRI